MTTHPDYKTLPGGSIDYAHYIRRSHELRSHDAHALIRRLATCLRVLSHKARGNRYPQLVRRSGPSTPRQHGLLSSE
jgi:hypothetical protein